MLGEFKHDLNLAMLKIDIGKLQNKLVG